MEYLISVIVPMYNVEKYIKECIESILSQSYKNIELIIVDDGSTDNSYNIAKSYQKENSKVIKLIKQQNNGQAVARNKALKVAKGELISFIDSDDFIEINMFEKMISVIKEYDLDIVECNYMNWFGEKENNSIYKSKILNDVNYCGSEYYELYPSLSPCDKIYKKEFLDEINFSFEEGHYAEDTLAISQAVFFAKKIRHINDVLYYYRRISINSTRNSMDYKKTIKLGKDKLYIAYKLNEFKNKHNWEGVVRIIILRSIFGTICRSNILKKEYRAEIMREFKLIKGSKIISENFKLCDVFKFLMIGFRRAILKED
ncbi:glycosyltransferase [Clostridium estertheticum]|uniref:glycosyltransferase n=1 Tax=Clostridium estertheticum TaxID=238834 RepID=UPI001C0DD47E|nr:glycosyltransferase [Clostridium estertheticum]MBU3172986.1 glycosyltransferase [Clostridium estertheticum]